jgi:hypothetical protein
MMSSDIPHNLPLKSANKRKAKDQLQLPLKYPSNSTLVSWSYSNMSIEPAGALVTSSKASESTTVTKKWNLDENARACVSMEKRATLLITSAALHEISSAAKSELEPSLHMNIAHDELQWLKEAFNEAYNIMKSNKEGIIIKAIANQMDQFVLNVSKVNSKMRLNMKRIIPGSAFFSEGRLPFVADRGVTLNWKQTTKLKRYFKLIEDHAALLTDQMPVFTSMFKAIAGYLKKFSKINELLQEECYKHFDDIDSYVKVVEEESKTVLEFISQWDLHTDIVKICSEDLKEQNITTRINLNNLFNSCCGKRQDIIDYYLGLEEIGLEIAEIQKNKRIQKLIQDCDGEIPSSQGFMSE